jgi:hypothetical protein
MATADYEKLLKERRYELTGSPLLEPVRVAGIPTGHREVIATGRRKKGDSVVEVQLQRSRSGRSTTLAGVAQLNRTSGPGDGLLLPKPWYGVYKSFTSGPYIAVAVLALFMCSGVGFIMLPGLALFWLLAQSARRSSGLKEWSDLASPAAARNFAVWGLDHDSARDAMVPAIQDALMHARWYGLCAVREGLITLDRPIGHGRKDLFKALLDAVDALDGGAP